MSIKYHETNMCLVIDLEGELTASNTMTIREEVASKIEECQKSVLINLEDVSYIDSTGLGLMVALHANLRSSDRKMALVGSLSDEMKKLFEVTQLNKFFKIYTNEIEAEGNMG